jgi:hypothetical protein
MQRNPVVFGRDKPETLYPLEKRPIPRLRK